MSAPRAAERSSRRSPASRTRRGAAPPADARRFRRPAASCATISRSSSRRRSARGEALDHVLFFGPAGPRQDDAGADRRARTGRRVPRHLGPGDPARRRPRRAAHQSAAARRPVHRRDPPADAGGRGNPLSGDGGFPARPDHRRGAGARARCASTCRPSRWSARRRARASSPGRCASASAFRCGCSSTSRPSWR